MRLNRCCESESEPYPRVAVVGVLGVVVGSEPLKLPLLFTLPASLSLASGPILLQSLVFYVRLCAAATATAAAAATPAAAAAAAVPVLASSARRRARHTRRASHPDASQFGTSGSFSDGPLSGFSARPGSFWPPLERSSARNPRSLASALASSPASSVPSNGPSFPGAAPCFFFLSMFAHSFLISHFAVHSLRRARGGPRSLLPFHHSR